MHKLFNTDFVLNISFLTTFIYLEWKNMKFTVLAC